MDNIFLIAAIWMALAVISSIIAARLRMSMALIEICVGIILAGIARLYFNRDIPGTDAECLKFMGSSGAVLLTFLAGAELEHSVMRIKFKEVMFVGLVGFLAPFLGCAALAHFVLDWSVNSSLLAGVALSTTSIAVVYAVMLETGLNNTEFGKGILGACFINDLGTVIMLGILFAPFGMKSMLFIIGTILVLAFLPNITKHLTKYYGNKTAAIRTKWIATILFGLGALALWSGSEAVLPAYLAGIVLANVVNRDKFHVRRLRTLTIGFLTPFYFIRAGTLVNVTAFWAAPIAIIILFGGKVVSKIFGLQPVISLFRRNTRERWYYTLMMSTGLTFGTISALYGLTNNIISQEQYSILVIVVIASAVIPTLIASLAYLPTHLLPQAPKPDEEVPQSESNGNG